MRLLDQIAHAGRPLVVDTPGAGRWNMPAADTLMPQVKETALRYVLDNEVTKACFELVLREAGMLGKTLDLIRCPAERLWVEWTDLDLVSADISPPAVTATRRCGILVEADEGGRRGRISPVWERSGDEPVLSPAEIEFDLDQDLTAASDDRSSAPIPSLAFPELADVLRHCRMVVRPAWAELYNGQGASAAELRVVLDRLVATVWSDGPFFFAFVLLLMAQGRLRLQQTDLRRLNEARIGRARPPLLEHIEVRCNLGPAERAVNDWAATGRRAARLHHVRGHLVRRGDKVFWRVPHLRGDPLSVAVVTRTTLLGMPRGSSASLR